jgi:hypothetical protein
MVLLATVSSFEDLLAPVSAIPVSAVFDPAVFDPAVFDFAALYPYSS